MTLIILKIAKQLFFRLSISLSLSEASSWLDSGYASGQKHVSWKWCSVPFIASYQVARDFRMSIAGDVNFDHLTKAASARLLHFKTTLPSTPIVVNILWIGTWRPFSLNFQLIYLLHQFWLMDFYFISWVIICYYIILMLRFPPYLDSGSSFQLVPISFFFKLIRLTNLFSHLTVQMKIACFFVPLFPSRTTLFLIGRRSLLVMC